MNRIDNPCLSWTADNTPFSDGFGDIYYKPDGLSETRTVFLEGNNLPQAWQNQSRFTIGETGFGTGLNFLATWKLFEETCHNGERLDFISVEQFPLSKDDLRRALQNWRRTIEDKYIDRFLAIYPPRIPGFHRRWITDRVTLTLIFDDALRGFKGLDCQIDAWFLDGFSPSKNETLWQNDLFRDMARLSHADTTLASFTAAGAVRTGLQNAGFSIQRIDGYRYKKHRIIGSFPNGKPKEKKTPPKTLRIIGAGLAGAGAAHALRRQGIAVEIFEREASLGMGASGNRLGLINPKIEAQDNPRTDAGLAAFSFANHILNDLSDIDYQRTGALHLAFDADKLERLEKLFRASSWLAPHMQWIKASETQALCGLDLPYDGLFYSDASSVNTRKLVERLLDDTSVRFDTTVTDTNTMPTLLACGWGLHTLAPHLPLQPVRGQMTYIDAPSCLLCPVMFGSYVAPTVDGLWALGATFEQNQSEPTLLDSARMRNLTHAGKMLPLDFSSAAIRHEWSQIRTASRDRFPIVGALRENLFVSGALGSHGIQFGLLFGEIIACMLTGAPTPVSHEALQALSLKRFA